MSVAISKKYPYDLSSEEINIAIKGMSEEILNSGAKINTVMQFSPLIQMGQNELQRRILDHASSNSQKTERIAIGIGILSILISLILFWLSSRSDNLWMEQELAAIRDLLTTLQH